ncbi:MAG: MBL fold metallo-hydrolase [Rhodospirillaceae bacterium]|nr:MBL fold metallo-hydrolase [Rhodospirillaceae bacterium]
MQAVMIPVTPFQQNCSLLWCTGTMRGAVTDPGGDLELIESAIAEQAVTVEKILITHGHLDHAGGTKDLAERLQVPVEGPHEADIFWIGQMEEQCRMFGFAGARTFEPDRWLKDGDTVSFGNVTMDVIHCPGHTPGHVVFVHRDAGFAVVGDVLFQGSIGRSDFPMGNHDELVASIRNKLFPLGDDIAFIPGHGPPSTFGQERQTNPFVSDTALGLA